MVKAGAVQLQETFGWYLTLKSIAESGVFNLAGHTPLKSAQLANLYEVFNYLAAVKAEQKVQENAIKQSHESARRK
jgi:hypothetical protein